jgi:cold shock CspA family protein
MARATSIVRMIGTIKFFRSAGGFGFIVRDDDGADVFFHVNDLAPGTHATAMTPGCRVVFDANHSAQGLRAVDVAVLPQENRRDVKVLDCRPTFRLN